MEAGSSAESCDGADEVLEEKVWAVHINLPFVIEKQNMFAHILPWNCFEASLKLQNLLLKLWMPAFAHYEC